jgi:hypothetical protein
MRMLRAGYGEYVQRSNSKPNGYKLIEYTKLNIDKHKEPKELKGAY